MKRKHEIAKPEIHKWLCVVTCEGKVPDGGDFPPRTAVESAIKEMGLKITNCSSGWNIIQ